MTRPGTGEILAGTAISGSIRISGAKELTAALENLVPAIEKKILRKAMRDAAKPILAAAKANAPIKSGQLKKSLRIRAMKRTRKGRLGVTVSTGKEGFYKGKQFYGAFVEFGTKHAPAHPYLRPAFDSQKATSVRIVELSVKSGLNDIARGSSRLSKLDPSLLLPVADDSDYGE